MSIVEAPCEAFNLMHILELPTVGHIKPNKESLSAYMMSGTSIRSLSAYVMSDTSIRPL